MYTGKKRAGGPGRRGTRGVKFGRQERGERGRKFTVQVGRGRKRGVRRGGAIRRTGGRGW